MKDKKILITGGTSGLGKELARKLTELGAKVIIAARDETRGNAVAAELGCKYIFCNVGDLQSCYELHEQIGDVDILINNAGIWTDDRLEEKDPSRMFAAFEVNVIGMIQLCNLFLPDLRKKDYGTIVNVSSVSALPLIAPDIFAKTYAATKAAVKRYSEALKADLKGTKIKVIQFFPDGFDANLYESAGWDKESAHNQTWMLNASDVADCLVFALTRPEDMHISSMVVEKVGSPENL
jgi:NADP-dependent 3-hydroxy acid dehydrogenase YdfG